MKTNILASPINMFFSMQIILLLLWLMVLRQTFLLHELEIHTQPATIPNNVFIVNIIKPLSKQTITKEKNHDTLFLFKKWLIIGHYCSS